MPRARKTKALALPPLPTAVFTALGAVPVVLVETIPDDDGKPSHDLGECNLHTRTIYLRADLNPAALWHTLFHEQAHFALFDGGVQLPHRQEEAVCDAVAIQRFQEMVTSR